MLVSPRSEPARDESSVVGRLEACHGRIRHFLDLAAKLPHAAASAAEIAEAALQVARYFSVGYPLHAADEEESLLPRLSLCSPSLGAALERMTDEHHDVDTLLSSLLPVWRGAAAWPADRAGLHAADALRADLDQHLRGHLALEEAEIFPAVARLSVAHQADLIKEMRLRRR